MGFIHRTWKVEGVATNVTSSVLGYSTADFGVKRTVTGDTVVGSEAGTVMDLVATGTYQHEFAEPAPDLQYTYRITVVYDGRTYRFEDTMTGAESVTTLSLDYADLYADVSDRLGTGRSPVGDNLTRAKRCVQSAFRQILAADGKYSWTFLTGSTTITVDAGDTAKDLPSAVHSLIGDFAFSPGDVGMRLRERDANQIDFLYAGGGNATGVPVYYAVKTKEFASATGTRREFIMFPCTGSTTTFYYNFRVHPDAISDKVMGDHVLHEALREMSLAIATEDFDDNVSFPSTHRQLAEVLVEKAIGMDARNKPRSVGYNANQSGLVGPLLYRHGTVTYTL